MKNDTGSITEYGFRWGPIIVTRIMATKIRKNRELRVLSVKSIKEELEIYASKTGKFTVYRKTKDGLRELVKKGQLR